MNTSLPLQLYRRALMLAMVLLAGTGYVVWRLSYLQLGSNYGTGGDPTGKLVATYTAQRGCIYDLNGFLLAAPDTRYDVGAAPSKVGNVDEAARSLAAALDTAAGTIKELLQTDKPYVPLKRSVSRETMLRARAIGPAYIQADPRPGRVYPHGQLAASLLGFVNEDRLAYYGVEGYYAVTLAGVDGERSTAKDPLGSLFYDCRLTRDGSDLYLTVDRNAQVVVEEALQKAVSSAGARKGVAIVMEPSTGAIRAMANVPTYDPNQYPETDQSLFTNPAVSDHYEPGSVFKIITMAAALDAGVVTPSSTYYDSGTIMVGGQTIRNSDRLAHGVVSMADLLAQSLNVGSAHLSTLLGAYRFYDYVRRFGFGELTGIGLAYELPGVVRVPGDANWHESDLGTNSFGQGLTVTPLQMICAVSAVANEGKLMRPMVVSTIVDGDNRTTLQPQVVAQVISPRTAKETTEMLVRAVDRVLTGAAVPGYQVAGKSGTSEVAGAGGYDKKETIASFAGFFPAKDARLAILVVLDQPQTSRWGLEVAAPAFREIAQRLAVLYGLPPDRP